MVEEAFSEIEHLTTAVFDKISSGVAPTSKDRITLATFLVLQHQRTPRMREDMRFIMTEGAQLYMEAKLSDVNAVRRFLQDRGQSATDEDVESFQAEMTALLSSGIRPVPGWNAEVLGQFALADELPARLCAGMTWRILRAGGNEEFIISDHLVHIFDPKAIPHRSGAWFSSPAVQVTFPVDRKTCLLIHPGPPQWY